MDKHENESWNAYAKRMNYIYESELDGRELLLNKQEILEYEKDYKEREAQRVALLAEDPPVADPK